MLKENDTNFLDKVTICWKTNIMFIIIKNKFSFFVYVYRFQ